MRINNKQSTHGDRTRYWHLVFVLVIGLLYSFPYPADAQQSVQGIRAVATERAVVNVTDLARREAQAPTIPRAPKVVHPPMSGPSWQGRQPALGPDTITPENSRASVPLTVPLSPAPTDSFLALEDDNNVIPPDTHGAVGPNHLMVVLNTQVRIQDRTGTPLSTVSLDSFWASLSNPDVFDPKVLYDPFADRWMFTAMADPRLATSSVLIGVSQTSDPTGTWNLYRIDVDATDMVWADYPSMGFNKDWIVVSTNMFTVAVSSFVRTHIYVFDKANLYASGAGNFTLLQDTSGLGFTHVPAITYDNTLSTLYLLEEDFSSKTGTYGTGSRLRLSTITGAVGFETLTLSGAFPTASSAWDYVPPSNNFAPQLGSATGIMTNDARIQNVVYRNGSLWTTHTIFLPTGAPTRSSVQWWEINPSNGSVIQRGRIDDSSGNTFYAFPSIAVNLVNDALVGYSRFSATQYASGNYSFRSALDAANTLQADTVLKAGEDTYIKDFGFGRVRWGDYSNTVVDPVNDCDLWTIQEYAAVDVGPSSNNDRWGTWWGRIVSPTSLVDLEIVSKTDSPDPVQLGGSLTYSVTVRNNGCSNATGVTLTDTLPGSVTFGSATPSQGSCSESGGTVTCNLGNLTSGNGATVTITVTPNTAGTITNTASVTGNEGDPDTSNNSASESTTVIAAADLAVTKSDSPDPVLLGLGLTYTVTVINNGPNNATGVTLTDTLPGSVTFGSATGSCSESGGTVTCNLGSLASGNSAVVTITVTPNTAGTITNTANVTGNETDPNTTNNTASEDTTVQSGGGGGGGGGGCSLKPDSKFDPLLPLLLGLSMLYFLRQRMRRV